MKVERSKTSSGIQLAGAGVRQIDADRQRLRIKNQAAAEEWTDWQLKMALRDVKLAVAEGYSIVDRGFQECLIIGESTNPNSTALIGEKVLCPIRDADLWNGLYRLIADNDEEEMLTLVSSDGQRGRQIRRMATVYFPYVSNILCAYPSEVLAHAI